MVNLANGEQSVGGRFQTARVFAQVAQSPVPSMDGRCKCPFYKGLCAALGHNPARIARTSFYWTQCSSRHIIAFIAVVHLRDNIASPIIVYLLNWRNSTIKKNYNGCWVLDKGDISTAVHV